MPVKTLMKPVVKDIPTKNNYQSESTNVKPQLKLQETMMDKLTRIYGLKKANLKQEYEEPQLKNNDSILDKIIKKGKEIYNTPNGEDDTRFTYNEDGKQIRKLTPIDRALYNLKQSKSSFDKGEYKNTGSNLIKTVFNVADLAIEPAAQVTSRLLSLGSRSGGMILDNLSSLDRKVDRNFFSKKEQDIIDKTVKNNKDKNGLIKRTEYGSEYGISNKKNGTTGEQIKKKLLNPADQVTNVLGNASIKVNKDGKKSIYDVYNFDKDSNGKSEEEMQNMSIAERVYKMVKSYNSGRPIDEAIASNLRRTGALVKYE